MLAPTDPSSVLIPLGSGVGGAIVGGLAVYARVSERLARIETRQDAIELTAVRIEKKIDDNQARSDQTTRDNHRENQSILAEVRDQLTAVQHQTERREKPRP